MTKILAIPYSLKFNTLIIFCILFSQHCV